MQRAHSLFYALVALGRPRTICDVGSCDGTAAFRFRKLRPRAQVIAFEANPDNHAAIRADPRSSGIEIRPEAVTDEDGEATFHVLDVPPSAPWVKTVSSLNRRKAEMEWGFAEHEVTVPACRLDTVLRDAPGPIALWVDVEGAAHRVVNGLAGIAHRVSFLCIELEPTPLWEGQPGASAVLQQLKGLGFLEATRSHEWSDGELGQVNVVLTREVGQPALLSARVAAAALQGTATIIAAAHRAVGKH